MRRALVPVAILTLVACKDQNAEFNAVPGAAILYPHATLLDVTSDRHYGTNDEASDPFAWWDAELAKIGYRRVKPADVPKRVAWQNLAPEAQAHWVHSEGDWYSASVARGPCRTKDGIAHPYKRCIHQHVVPKRFAQ